MKWHNLTVEETLKELDASRSGLSEEKAKEIVQAFLTTEFEGGRHLRRIEKIGEIEKE